MKVPQLSIYCIEKVINMGKKVFLLLICSAFLLGGCFRDLKLNHNQEEFGKHETQLDYQEHYFININYPNTGIEDLDKEIKRVITQEQSTFLSEVKHYKEERKAEFNIKYETHIKEERYLSIKLMIYRSIYQNEEYTKTIHYDLEKEDFFDLNDILEDDYLDYIATQAREYFESNFPEPSNTTDFRIGITAIEDNYKNFVLRNEGITFYFAPKVLFDYEATYTLSYEKLKSYTNLKQETKSVFVPYDQVLNEPVKVIDPNKPMIALTFDDGPTRKYTTAILDSLKENNASATFFILGSRANSAPDLLQRMILEGNEIGNHTYSHKQLTTLSKQRIEEEISATQESIHNITNKYPDVIRPPYGSRNDQVMSCAGDKRIVTWTLDTEDWRSKDVKAIVKHVLDTVKDKDIILMHDLYASSAEAVMILVPELVERGYQLVTVSELYEYSQDHQYEYKP